MVRGGPWPLKVGVLGPAAAAASPGSLLGMQILGPWPRPSGSEPAFHKTMVDLQDIKCEVPGTQAEALGRRMMVAVAIPGSLRYRLLFPDPRSRAHSASLLSLLVFIPTGFGRCIHFLVMSSSHHTCIEFLSSPGTGANSASLNDPLIGCLPPAL